MATSATRPFRLDGPPDAITKRRPRVRRFDTLGSALEAARKTGWLSWTVTGPDGWQWHGSGTVTFSQGTEEPTTTYREWTTKQDALDVG